MTNCSLTPPKSRAACASDAPGPHRAPRPRTRTRRAQLAAEALAVIDANCRAPLTVDAVAAAVFTSRRQLQRVLIEEAGVTFREAHRRARISHAQMLLADGEVRVGQAAHRVGYRSASEFTKVFRAVTGELPSHMRRRARRGTVSPPASR